MYECRVKENKHWPKEDNFIIKQLLSTKAKIYFPKKKTLKGFQSYLILERFELAVIKPTNIKTDKRQTKPKKTSMLYINLDFLVALTSFLFIEKL